MATELVQTAIAQGSEGVIQSSLTGDRLFVLPVSFWTEAVQMLEKAFGKPIGVVMEHFAEEYGTFVAAKTAAMGLEPESAVETLKEVAAAQGWGKIEVTGDTKRGSRLAFAIENCAFCKAKRGSEKKGCDFMAGLAVGVAEKFYGRPYQGVLQEGSVPGEHCLIELKETSEAKKAAWKSAVYFPWMIDSRV
jgi:predicted hydrocarbon binding protein